LLSVRLDCLVEKLMHINFSGPVARQFGGVNTVLNHELPLSEAIKLPATKKAGDGVLGGRLAREFRTMAAMIDIYCWDHHAAHGDSGLCPECQSLLDYAAVRLERCRFGEGKPTCAKCPVHCYQARRREEVKAVMRYAGPRMVWHHPVLAIRHMLDGWRSA
jgi:hypothetical protein